MKRAAPRVLGGVLTMLVVLLFATALCAGPVFLEPGAMLGALLADTASPFALIVREIRLPRAILAVLTGASLGLAGAALQGLTRNPLAEPGIIGISGCAALAAVLAAADSARFERTLTPSRWWLATPEEGLLESSWKGLT